MFHLHITFVINCFVCFFKGLLRCYFICRGFKAAFSAMNAALRSIKIPSQQLYVMSECFFNASICVCFNSLKQSCLQVNQKLKLRLVTCHSSFVSHMHTPYTHCTSLSFSLFLSLSYTLLFPSRLGNVLKMQ